MKRKWLFAGGGTCKKCNGVGVTELNKNGICYYCYTGKQLPQVKVEKKFVKWARRTL